MRAETGRAEARTGRSPRGVAGERRWRSLLPAPPATVVALAGAAAVVALLGPTAAAPAGAQTVELLDEGRFEHRVGGREVAVEVFAIRRNGPRLEAVARVTGQESAPLVPAEVRLRLDDRNRPEEIRLRLEGEEGRSVAAVRGDERIRLEEISPAGRRSREFLAPPGVSMFEPGIAHHYFLLFRQHGDALTGQAWLERRVLVPSRTEQLLLRLRREGPDSVRVAGELLPSVRHTVTVNGEEIRVWLDDRGRVLRVERPERGWSAHRREVAEP